jgi:hypothetical protein
MYVKQFHWILSEFTNHRELNKEALNSLVILNLVGKH